MKKLIVFILFVLMASTIFAECTKDTDCKGDRLCVKGACEFPPKDYKPTQQTYSPSQPTYMKGLSTLQAKPGWSKGAGILGLIMTPIIGGMAFIATGFQDGSVQMEGETAGAFVSIGLMTIFVPIVHAGGNSAKYSGFKNPALRIISYISYGITLTTALAMVIVGVALDRPIEPATLAIMGAFGMTSMLTMSIDSLVRSSKARKQQTKQRKQNKVAYGFGITPVRKGAKLSFAMSF